MKNKFHFILFFLLPLFAFSQTTVDKQSVFTITINNKDNTTKVQVMAERHIFKPDENLTYFWYASDKIIETKGGGEGKLLHGTYTIFYLNKQLKEKGNFDKGLKDRKWMSWYPDGKVMEISNWKQGIKHGKYELYNELGQKVVETTFKGGNLDGTMTSYSGHKILSEKQYKNGEEVIPKLREQKTVEQKSDKQRMTFKEWFHKTFRKNKGEKDKSRPSKEEKDKPITS